MQNIESAFQKIMALPQSELNLQHAPSQSAKDAVGVLDDMIARTAAAKSARTISSSCDIAYGPRPRQRLDVFCPARTVGPMPCLVFIHGGFWQEGDKSVAGFAAQTFAALGWACVSLGYSLTPDVTLKELAAEVRDAVRFLNTHAARYGIDSGRIVVAGHSAGAHLSACLLTGPSAVDVAGMVRGMVLISGVYELAPVAKSYVSVKTPIDESTAATLSPLRHWPVAKMPVHVVVGSDEPDAFQVQSTALRNKWQPLLPQLTYQKVPGRDHFDVLCELTDPSSDVVQRICAMV